LNESVPFKNVTNELAERRKVISLPVLTEEGGIKERCCSVALFTLHPNAVVGLGKTGALSEMSCSRVQQ
jgi:hypothetical protein